MTRSLARVLLVFVSVAPLVMGFRSLALAQSTDEAREVFLFRVTPASFEDLMSVPEFADLARAGGAALLSYGGAVSRHMGDRDALGVDDDMEYIVSVRSQLAAIGEAIEGRVRMFGARRVLVIVMSLVPTPAMERTKDDLYPVIVAEGTPKGVFLGEGEMQGLTSDSTRRPGVVTDADILATIAAFRGEPAPLDGSAIRVVDGPAPFLLHERYLAQRRMYVPVGEAAALYLVLVGLLGVAFVALGSRVPAGARRVVGWGCLSVSALATGMLAAGHLPELTYSTVVPFIAIVTVFGTLAFSPLEGRSLTLVPAGIGVAVLVYFGVEALLEWSGALATFLGGTHLDGGRFYGLPNAFIGLLAGAGLYVAQRLRTSAGFALLLVMALVAGSPFAGANLGGAVTLFAAAGLWVAVRERERLGPWRGLGVLALTVVAGTVLILLAHRVWPVPTHITRFEENAGGPAGIWRTFVDRLGVGIDLIRRNPAALVPVLGMPVALLAVLRPPASVRATFERWPAWRDAVLVTLLTGTVAYLANDSGPAAAGLAFGLGLGGMLGVSLLAAAGKMDGS